MQTLLNLPQKELRSSSWLLEEICILAYASMFPLTWRLLFLTVIYSGALVFAGKIHMEIAHHLYGLNVFVQCNNCYSEIINLLYLLDQCHQFEESHVSKINVICYQFIMKILLVFSLISMSSICNENHMSYKFELLFSGLRYN